VIAEVHSGSGCTTLYKKHSAVQKVQKQHEKMGRKRPTLYNVTINSNQA
jgi:hypothetical protein